MSTSGTQSWESLVGTPAPSRRGEKPPVLSREAHSQTLARSPDDDQETDICYGGYASRAVLGSFVLCTILTLASAVALWTYWPQVRAEWGELLLLSSGGFLGALWILQLVRWTYRILAINLRLTTRRLFYDRGFLNPDSKVIELALVTRVEVRRNPLERCGRVGRILVFSETSPLTPTTVEGIAKPRVLAEIIRRHASKARERGVTSLGVPISAISQS